MLQEPMTLPSGAVIQGQNGERYIVEGLLGKGGFSAVYLVRDRRNRERVFALKELINPAAHERSHLAFETELLMRLEHRALPHIYKVFENVKLQRVYMVMDYVAGKDLEALREDQPDKRFSVPLTLALMTPIVEAVMYLHEQKPPIVHRDIKPANIVVPVGARDTVLVDFGIAKEYVADKTTSVFRYGTPGYAAPEQYGQGTNLRTDIYALAATFYTLVTGKLPTDALTRSVEAHAGDPLQPAHELCPAVPEAVSQVLARAMKLRCEERYPTVDDFWRNLSIAAMQRQKENQLGSIPNTPLPFTITQQDVRKPLITTTHRAAAKTIKQYPTRKVPLWLLTLLALVIIGVGVEGTVLYISLAHQKTTSVHQNPSVHPKAVSIIDCPLASFAPVTPIAPQYLQIAPGYIGTIGDVTISGNTTMCLSAVQQNHDQFTGMFSGLGFLGKFTGSISNTPTTKVHFTVVIGQDRTLSFDGDVRLSGEMAGTFQMLDKDGQTMEAGVWQLSVASLKPATPTP